MPKYLVEYYACEAQETEIEAESRREAEEMVLNDLAAQHAQMGRPADWTFGVLVAEEIEPEEEEEDEADRYERERQAHPEPVKMCIESRVPSKWRFLDLETSNVWRWDEDSGKFVHA